MREVGPLLELPHSWVGKVETGERRLDVIEYVHLCRVIGADPNEGLSEVQRALGPYKPAGASGLKAADGAGHYQAGSRRKKASDNA